MTDRETRSVRIDPEIWRKFVDWVVDKEGKKHSEVGRHVENAIIEYIDHGRDARIEEKVDAILATLDSAETTHTHTEFAASDTVEKARNVIERIRNNHGSIIKDDDVTRAIEDMAGADPRTVQKYKDILKRRELLWEHPSDSPVWTTDQMQFVEWAESYIDNNPSVEVFDVINEYPIESQEYDTVVQTIQN